MACCLCKEMGVEVHHIVPQEENGPNTDDNAAPLCPSCHETYGANPQKRKFIREARELWYEICAKRFASDPERLDEIKRLLKKTVSYDDLTASCLLCAGCSETIGICSTHNFAQVGVTRRSS